MSNSRKFEENQYLFWFTENIKICVFCSKVKIQYKITFEDNINQVTFFAGYLTAIVLGLGFLVSEETETLGKIKNHLLSPLRHAIELRGQNNVRKSTRERLNEANNRRKVGKRRRRVAHIAKQSSNKLAI